MSFTKVFCLSLLAFSLCLSGGCGKDGLDGGVSPTIDSDNDGILDVDEINNGTSPYNADSDCDGETDDQDLYPTATCKIFRVETTKEWQWKVKNVTVEDNSNGNICEPGAPWGTIASDPAFDDSDWSSPFDWSHMFIWPGEDINDLNCRWHLYRGTFRIPETETFGAPIFVNSINVLAAHGDMQFTHLYYNKKILSNYKGTRDYTWCGGKQYVHACKDQLCCDGLGDNHGWNHDYDYCYKMMSDDERKKIKQYYGSHPDPECRFNPPVDREFAFSFNVKGTHEDGSS